VVIEFTPYVAGLMGPAVGRIATAGCGPMDPVGDKSTEVETSLNRRVVVMVCLSVAAGLAMAYKLIEQAQTRWRMVNAPHLVALVRAGVKFEKGVMVERSDEQNEEVAA
jgi:hypothetical protein